MRGIALLALVLLAAAVAPATAVAQETATPENVTATATPTATPTPTATATPEPSTATAAPADETAAPTNGTAAPPEGERIDGNTELLDASYDSETGMISVRIRSSTLQPITITDAGAFMTGGEVEQRTVTLREGETSTIKIPATEYEGFVGVSIATSQTLYAVPIEISKPWFRGDPTWDTTRVVGIGAVAGVLGIAAWLARKRLRGGPGEVERIA